MHTLEAREAIAGSALSAVPGRIAKGPGPRRRDRVLRRRDAWPSPAHVG